MKILYVTTISNTINAFLIPHIKMLINEGHQVDLAFKTEHAISSEIFELGCNLFEISFSRSPINKHNFKAYRLLKNILKEGNYDIVHTHTPIASAITRLICKNIKGLKVIYTAHGFHFYNGAPLINWLIYYPIEKYLSKYTDVIITINKEDYNRAKLLLKSVSVVYMPGVGLDVENYNNIQINKVKKKQELDLPEKSVVLLSVGELNSNKNHAVIIRALAKLKNNDLHYIVCGEGSNENYLRKLAEKLNLNGRVHLLGHRNDVNEIHQISDIFVFPSKREGLGLAAIEAMASGLPLITSNVHGINDYSKPNFTGFAFKPNDAKSFSKAIKKLCENSELRISMGIFNKENALKYDIKNILELLKAVYEVDKNGES